jgi:hypothetical protein
MDALTYNDVPIHIRGERLNLTDMWRAAGRPKNMAVWDWRKLPGCERFVEHIAAAYDLGISQVFVTEPGRGKGTWAHWQIGMAYAKYLSVSFHAWCNEVVRRYMEGKGFPARDERLSEELARQIGGIVKAVTQRALEPIREDVGVLRREFDRWTDPRNKLVPDRLGIREILDRAGAVTKGRRRLQNILTGHLKRYCKAAGFNIDDSRDQRRPEQVLLYPLPIIHTVMQEVGARLVADHNATAGAQYRLPFPKLRK